MRPKISDRISVSTIGAYLQVLEWVKDGVRDFSISRAAVEWGIRIPADPKQTVYVWFDALLGYVSGPPTSDFGERLSSLMTSARVPDKAFGPACLQPFESLETFILKLSDCRSLSKQFEDVPPLDAKNIVF